jgi:hypothetical protein
MQLCVTAQTDAELRSKIKVGFVAWEEPMSLPGLTEYSRIPPDVLMDFMHRYRVSLRNAFFSFYGDNDSVDDAMAEYRKDGLIDSDFSTFMANHLSPYCGKQAA